MSENVWRAPGRENPNGARPEPGGPEGAAPAPYGPPSGVGPSATPGTYGPPSGTDPYATPGAYGPPAGVGPYAAPAPHGPPTGTDPYAAPGAYGPPAGTGPHPAPSAAGGPPGTHPDAFATSDRHRDRVLGGHGYDSPAYRNDSLAVTSMVLGVIGIPIPGICLLAVAFGHLAQRRLRTSYEGGRGLAIAGLAMGYAMTAIWLGIFVLFLSARTML